MSDMPLSTEALQAENQQLRRRIDELIQQLDKRNQLESELHEVQQLVQFIIDGLPFAVYWKDRELVYRGCNHRFAQDIGLQSSREIIGKADRDLPWQPGEADQFEVIDRRIMETRTAEQDLDETIIHADGNQEWFETYKNPLLNEAGEVVGVLGTYINITARKRAEAMISAQAEALTELSTPLMPIADNVIVMPLVGAIDSRRAQQIMEVLLEGISEQQAETAILDITGVKVVDTQVASALLRTAQAAQLLGAQVVLTGISSEVAQALVHLGATLGGVVTLSNLQSGITYALNRSATDANTAD
jgi:rsbT co-antagonist protein RsbR